MTQEVLKMERRQYFKQLKRLLELRNIDLDGDDEYSQQVRILIELLMNTSERITLKESFESTMRILSE